MAWSWSRFFEHLERPGIFIQITKEFTIEPGEQKRLIKKAKVIEIGNKPRRQIK